MEVKSAKGLDDRQTIMVDLKRKRAAKYASYFTGSARAAARGSAWNALPKRFLKRMRSQGCNTRGSHVQKSLLRNYSNFMKSGLPQRLLFYYNAEWIDFPEGVMNLVKEDFRLKKAAIQVEFKGCLLLLDFLHMIRVDLKTGLQHPLAWIDEGGSCFFPELYSDVDQLNDYMGQTYSCSEPTGTQEIKLQLEIEITGNSSSKLEECSGESNTHVKRLKIEGKPARDHCKLDEEFSSDVKQPALVEEAVGENRLFGAFSLAQKPVLKNEFGSLDTDAVNHMFTAGMGSTLLEIQRVSDYLAQARLELFQKQVEITCRRSGNANVRYAWLSLSKESRSRILKYGLGFDSLPKIKPTYGIGIHLAPANCPRISASYCDVDENGVQNMVLCRVILGNMELVHPGSEQFHPSSENFDSGVDDLGNPKHYIIWSMNMNTHIYPEFFISFRTPPGEKGHLLANESKSKLDVSGVTNSASCQKKLQLDPSPTNSVGDDRSSPNCVEALEKKRLTARLVPKQTPKSPWMPFPRLFDAIKHKVPCEDMKSVYLLYEQFRKKQISREFLVQKLRCTVGDALLKSTILSLQEKPQPPFNRDGAAMAMVTKEEEGSSN